ncbi:hypothetical protein H9627_08725 [Corynebacterium sp. Sa1YVA5]|uniref:Cardiolipin synthase N-terminal domain-containing protein n=2 Tax=Corynebacterium gallinarum TaxID=2762214 RepID=A0A8I0HEM4_9CORY|nr:hypothetical protein [Corynebacterium gallinarum]
MRGMSEMRTRWKDLARSIRADWLDLPTELRFPLMALAAGESAARIATWLSLARRPADRVRGPRWAWAGASLVVGAGPMAYWMAGRK